jgi:polyphosphate kinase
MAQEDTPHPSPLTPDHYIYRNLSLLEFQRRVLEQARAKNTPLLERVKFLTFTGAWYPMNPNPI